MFSYPALYIVSLEMGIIPWYLFYVTGPGSFKQVVFNVLPRREHIRYNLGVQVFPMAVY